jgi:hypothetical protein
MIKSFFSGSVPDLFMFSSCLLNHSSISDVPLRQSNISDHHEVTERHFTVTVDNKIAPADAFDYRSRSYEMTSCLVRYISENGSPR